MGFVEMVPTARISMSVQSRSTIAMETQPAKTFQGRSTVLVILDLKATVQSVVMLTSAQLEHIAAILKQCAPMLLGHTCVLATMDFVEMVSHA